MPDRSRDTGCLPPNLSGTIVTVGTFDGVHRGHLAILDALVKRAAATQLPSFVVTFRPHPLEVLRPHSAPQLLTSDEEKLEILAALGVNYVYVVPFTKQLSRLGAAEFVDLVLLRRVHMRELLVGYDHGFGRGRSGDVELLQAAGAKNGFRVTVVPPVMGADGVAVSSTVVRRAVAAGDMKAAADGLGRHYSVNGIVETGAGRGRTMGFPTINVALPGGRKLLPPHGVYAVRVQTPSGLHGGMLSLGPRPTFADDGTTMEAHLFDVRADFYGARVRVDFVAWLREIARFSDAAELRAAMAKDEANARDALTMMRGGNNINSLVRNPA